MSNRYVDVTITRQTKTVSQKGFGMPLILSHEKAMPYKEYSGDSALADISTDFGGTSTKTYKLAAALLSGTPKVDKIAILGILWVESATVAPLTDALNTLILDHNDFFYVTCTAQADATITALSTWIATQEKFYFASTLNKTLSATLNNLNAVILVHPTPATYPAEAWIGACAPLAVGSFTWTFKTLNGIVPSNYNTTDINTIEANKASTYIKEGGVNITSKGQTTNGEYIDIIQSQYYVKSRMVEAVFGLLARMPKVPFTDNGIALVVSEVEGVLKDSFNQGIIAADAEGNPIFTVDAPTRSEVSASDRANRVLPNIAWSATIAGAVENADISGSLLV